MDKQITFNPWTWFLAILAVVFMLTACTTPQKSFEIQCLDPARRDIIAGPVVMNEDDIIFYDSKGRMVKVQAGTCGVK